MSFGASNTYESLLQRASILNDVDAFPILASRMEQSGFKLLRVVYRGYSTSDKVHHLPSRHARPAFAVFVPPHARASLAY